MKILFQSAALFLILLASFTSYGQCDSIEYVVEGVFKNNSKTNLQVEVTSSELLPEVGKIVSVSKYGEKKMFGSNMTFWLGIADAEVKQSTEKLITLKVIKETSEIIINGKKKNHFEKGLIVKLKWKDKAQEIPHVILDEKDTVEVGQYLCGKKWGEWKTFYPFGKIKNVANYENDLLNGRYEIYFENGQLKEEGSYSDGEINGEVKIYNEAGNLIKRSHAKDGKFNGETIEYYESGAVKSKKNYKNGKLNGEVRDFFENGNPATLGIYNEEGVLHGKALIYFEDQKGVIKFDREYTNGERTGYYNSFHENGNPKVVGSTVKNILDKEYKEYYDNKQLKLEGTLKNGKRTGVWKEYYENGNLKEKGEYKEDQKVGDWEGYYENGEQAFEGSYDQDSNKTGKWSTWDEKGKKSKEKY